MLEIKGLNETVKQLDSFAEKAQALDGDHNVSVSALFSSAFMSKYTNFEDIDKMFKTAGIKVESKEDFSSLAANHAWNEFVHSSSAFEDWNDMFTAAGNEWATKKLGL